MCARLNLKPWMWWKPMKSHHNFPRVFVWCELYHFYYCYYSKVYTHRERYSEVLGACEHKIRIRTHSHSATWTNSYFMAIKRQHNLCLWLKFSSASSSSSFILNLYVICMWYTFLCAHTLSRTYSQSLSLGAWRLLWDYLKFYCIQSMFFGSNVLKDI